jgi:hypothetical protein
MGARFVVAADELRQMQRAGEPCRSRAHDEHVRIEPLAFARHAAILAKAVIRNGTHAVTQRRVQPCRDRARLVTPVCLFPVRLRSRFDKSDFALSSSARRDLVSPVPARLMKYVSMRMPDCGPLGETFFEANVRAMVGAFFVKSPAGGCVESVFTRATQRWLRLRFKGSPGVYGIIMELSLAGAILPDVYVPANEMHYRKLPMCLLVIRRYY